MTPREEKALEVAAKFRIVESSGKWLVPSQSSPKKYAVQIVGNTGDCTCPDFELRREPCKHMLAVRYVIQRDYNADGSTTVTEVFQVTKRTTYKQQWSEYNQAQTNEKDYFQVLLHDLCSGIPTPEQSGKGQQQSSACRCDFCSNLQGLFNRFGATIYVRPSRIQRERLY